MGSPQQTRWVLLGPPSCRKCVLGPWRVSPKCALLAGQWPGPGGAQGSACWNCTWCPWGQHRDALAPRADADAGLGSVGRSVLFASARGPLSSSLPQERPPSTGTLVLAGVSRGLSTGQGPRGVRQHGTSPRFPGRRGRARSSFTAGSMRRSGLREASKEL